MSCLLYVDEEEAQNKIDIDELYEKKHQRDLKQISVFNKILNRIHKRIQLTGRNKKVERHIWFTVPEYIFGEPNYDQGECLGYIISKLEENGFSRNICIRIHFLFHGRTGFRLILVMR